MQIPGYTIIKTIGFGGMATVYQGIQNSLKRKVAIKVINQKLANHPLALSQFERESYIIAQLNHPHVIHVIDKGLLNDKTPYFIMEYIEGHDLAHLIKQGGIELNKKIEILIQVCKALSYAHKNGVIHQDIKPANIFIDNENHAHVLDFGIAQFCDSDLNSPSDSMTMGTLDYMSPEQHSSPTKVTTLSDIYSLGVVMYFLMTGQKPKGNFAKPSELTIGINPILDDLIINSLSDDPHNRPASADKVKEILLKLLGGTHINKEQRAFAEQDISNLKKRFSLLDVLKEEKHSAVYLYENNNDQSLLIIKKQPVWSKGFNETNLIKPLTHHHIAKIFGTSKNDRTYIIVMEYLSGGSLQDRLIISIPWHEALIMIREVCLGLAFAHQNNITHGNLRPSNILFDENGSIKLTDFGLDAHYQIGSDKNWYKLQSENKTKRTDIFSTGIILYQLLTGSVPRWKNRKIAPTKRFDELPEQLKTMLSTMLSWSAASRQNSISQVVEEIDELLEYHSHLVTEKEKTQLWNTQKEKQKHLNKQRYEKKQTLIRWAFSLLTSICLAAIALYYKQILLLLN